MLDMSSITKREGTRQPASAENLLVTSRKAFHVDDLFSIEVNLQVHLGLAFHGLVVSSKECSLSTWLRNGSERGSLGNEEGRKEELHGFTSILAMRRVFFSQLLQVGQLMADGQNLGESIGSSFGYGDGKPMT